MANNVGFNPALLRLGREARGYTQTRLSRDAKVSQDYLSRYEAGLLPISSVHLERICATLNLPEAFFFRDERTHCLASSDFHPRARKTLRARVQSQELARMNIKRICIMRLLDSLDMETAFEFPQLDLEEFGGDVESVAREVRRLWGIPPGPIASVTTCIEDAGGVVSFSSFETPKIDGISQWFPRRPPVFFISDIKPGDRVRFTLAHELGHMVMHHRPTKDPEGEADRFASEFLIPRAEARGTLKVNSLHDLYRLKIYWRLSMAMILRRAKDIGDISPEMYTHLNIELSKAGYKRQEPIEVPVETPTLLKSAIDLHLDQLRYSVAELGELCAVSQADLEREFAQEMRTRVAVSGSTLRPKSDNFEIISFDKT